MQTTHPGLVASLLLFVSSYVNLSDSVCIRNGEHGVHCSTLDDIREITDPSNIHIIRAHPLVKELQVGTFRKFHNLGHLDISNGTLRRIEPHSFLHLSNLLHLNIAENQIKSIKAGTFKGLTHLVSLNLRNNLIKHLSQELLNLKSLQFVDLAGNPLECNCQTLTVRDGLVKRNITISKKTLCSSPLSVKGTSLMKPETHLLCLLDEAEKNMQMDQPTLNDEEGSGDYEEDYDETTEELNERQRSKEIVNPEAGSDQFNKSLTADKSKAGEEIFFDSDDVNKKPKNATTALEREEADEGSGNTDDEGSGLDGSGIGLLPHINWDEIQDENNEESSTASSEISSTTHSESIIDLLWNAFWTTAAPPEEKKIPDLEEEQFIHVTTPAATTKEKTDLRSGIVVEPTSENEVTKKVLQSFEPKPTKESEKLVNSDEDQSDKLNDSLANPKKVMGSYVVLAILLALIALLIGFAAYKGNFCRSKRKQGDLEDGTELKDMQKSLLEQNAIAPKVTSNGNTEISPLMDNKDDDRRVPENGTYRRVDSTDHCDPVKPPRKSLTEERTNTNGTNCHEQASLSAPQENKPPVSPGAQRVKITLQENPDSVPKTPVLITRLKPDDSLVKTP